MDGKRSHKARNIAIAVLTIIIILLLIMVFSKGLSISGISIPSLKLNSIPFLPNLSGISIPSLKLNSIPFLSNLFSGLQAYLTTSPKPNHLTIYFSTRNQYILGLGNRTVINGSNTTISLASGRYYFEMGSTNTINNSAETDLYIYNLTIYNTTALMAVKENNTVQWLNTGNGTFSVSLVRQILNNA